MEYTHQTLYKLCPSLLRIDVSVSQAVDRMVLAYKLNGHEVQSGLADWEIAIDYLLELQKVDVMNQPEIK